MPPEPPPSRAEDPPFVGPSSSGTDARSTGAAEEARSPETVFSAPRRLLVPLAVVAASAVAVLLSLLVGSESVPAAEVLRVLWQDDQSQAAVIVHELRVPRTLLGLGVGLALGLAGALMQSLTRNPLADPGILGVNAGAAAGMMFAVAVLGLRSFLSYVWLAFLGAGLAAVLVYLAAARGGGATPVRLALVGTALGTALGSATQLVVFLDPAAFDEYRFWVVGDIAGRDPDVLRLLLPFLVVGVALTFALAPTLNVLALGEDAGRALGARVGRTRLLAALAVLLLAGAATAAAGPVGFVGLAVPHLARRFAGTDQRRLFAYAAVIGPVLVLIADVVGRVIIAPAELQVSVVAAVIGAPFLIALVRRRRLPGL
ncbi:iron complex transport system permease protein [Actinoalloteichus hoggarensis]|uniref:Ferric enterobactin transport system permease protein FepD n=1 Tax=Actinoalloteichus hoggarensis TaxID=1470176 RepID=A0A221W6C6_9PSEU|nr:iron ABC transporter permease [Actinoalloteichus hoggarensis]ASO21139.1 Ferric enterobactin transport system permease protein FepD [Actinoalloteichus hoggarensis]MBB5921068.1 iron complex transport system permease protein [Actinoalloteichus hoggarensis]